MSSELLIPLEYALKAPGSPTNATSCSLKKSQRFLDDIQRWKFVLDLPLILLDDVSERYMTCCLCHQEYNRDFQVCGPETACQLPCGCFLGHLCAAEWFSPWQKANTACPVCKATIPELAIEPPTPMPRDAGFSQPSNLLRTSEWLRSQQATQAGTKDDAEMDQRIAALELDTGLHFFEGDDSIETLSATLTDYTSKKETTDSEEVTPPVGFRMRVNSNASVESDKRHGVPDFRGWGLARAALKAVDLMAKMGGTC